MCTRDPRRKRSDGARSSQTARVRCQNTNAQDCSDENTMTQASRLHLFAILITPWVAVTGCPERTPIDHADTCNDPETGSRRPYGFPCSSDSGCDQLHYCNEDGVCSESTITLDDTAFACVSVLNSCDQVDLAATGEPCLNLPTCGMGSCSAGVCVSDHEELLDDGDQCTYDICDANDDGGQVRHTPLSPEQCASLVEFPCQRVDPLSGATQRRLLSCLSDARDTLRSALLHEQTTSPAVLTGCITAGLCASSTPTGVVTQALSAPTDFYSCKDKQKLERAMADCESMADDGTKKCLGAAAVAGVASGGNPVAIAYALRVCLLLVADSLGKCYQRAVRDAGICNPSDECCGNTCIDVQSDSAHCGGCGKACNGPGQVCENGLCVCPAGTVLACWGDFSGPGTGPFPKCCPYGTHCQSSEGGPWICAK